MLEKIMENFIVLLLVLLVSFIIYVGYQSDQREKKCNELGGVMVGVNHRECVKVGAIINLKEEN